MAQTETLLAGQIIIRSSIFKTFVSAESFSFPQSDFSIRCFFNLERIKIWALNTCLYLVFFFWEI